MIKRIVAVTMILLFAYLFFQLIVAWTPAQQLNGVAYDYVSRGADELGAMNLVTAIVVTYRGLDTLGEVSVLFLAATGVAVLLRRKKSTVQTKKSKRPASDILNTGASLLVPAIIMFGAYIFLNGHLSPGGGFQGGAVVASAVLLLFITFPAYEVKHKALHAIESFSGATYVLVAILGLIFAGGFLDNRFLPLGDFGSLLSAGAIPVIYTLIGLKVGTELAGILENLKGQKS